MNAFFTLLEQLVSLTAPSIVVLQGILGITLLPVNNGNRYWHFYEARPASGLIARVVYRVPISNDPAKAPFLVIDLRDAPFRTDDFQKKYGALIPTDVSAHHPHFIGYGCRVNGYPVQIKVSTKNDAVLAVVIDFSERVVNEDSDQPDAQVGSSRKRPDG